MVRSILTILLLSTGLTAAAQVSFTIADGNITTCTGALLDSGGEGGAGYQDNENYTAVICPDNPGDAISLQWIIVNLNTSGTAPGDVITIYDGNSTSAPLLGSFTGYENPGNFSASFANPSGCLTVNFTSNNTGVGVFAAAITCYQPCEPPTAVASISGETIPALVCQGEMLTFDASASTAANGFTIVDYAWDFDDGTTSSAGAVVQHSFDEPGEYVVQVTLTDDNGCVNTNLVDLQVWVSTTPLFTGTSASTTICQGENVQLNGAATPVQWSALPSSNLGDGIFLPDEQGVPFSTSITFDAFEPGQTLTDVNGILDICVDMEHSFMGDLVISLACPSGQNVVFHQQGGGGTFLGVPVDNDATPNAQGECWNYCWSPTATNGTWVQNSGGTLAAGTYQSLQPFQNLLGCPLNGTWTFTVVDLWASDNGFLCNWELNFDPALFPSLTEFTPVLGLSSADSTSWTGTGYTSSTPASGVATPTEPGEFDYVFSVTDNFGCTYDTTITITVLPAPQGPILIEGPEPCSGNPITLTAPPGYDSYLWNNGSVGESIVVGTNGTYIVTVGLGTCTLPSEPFDAVVGNNPTAAFTGSPTSPVLPGAPVAFNDQSTGNGSTIDQWDWDFGYGDAASTEQSPTHAFNVPGTYVITLVVTTEEGCVDSTFITYVVRPEDIIIPNVFSPNGDGLNDFFVVENGQYYKNLVFIYNRWGQVIFEATNYQNTWRATDVPDGTYYYIYKLTESNREYAGHVTILR